MYVPPGQQPTPYTLVAPPAVYFSPLEGVKPAPEDLVREVIRQFGTIIPEKPILVGAPPWEPIVTVEPTRGVRWGEVPLPDGTLFATPTTTFDEAQQTYQRYIPALNEYIEPYPPLSPFQPLMGN